MPVYVDLTLKDQEIVEEYQVFKKGRITEIRNADYRGASATMQVSQENDGVCVYWNLCQAGKWVYPYGLRERLPFAFNIRKFMNLKWDEILYQLKQLGEQVQSCK